MLDRYLLIFLSGPRKNASFRFSFINKLQCSSVKVNILLSIKTCTFINVFVSFRYRTDSISKALLSKTFIIYQFFSQMRYSFTGGPSSKGADFGGSRGAGGGGGD